MRTEAPLLAPIFRSHGQAQVLSALLLTDDEVSISDLAARVDLAYPTVHREVSRLVDAGILVQRTIGRSRLVRASPDSPLVRPIREILAVATGPAVLLADELRKIDGVESAFLYGSFAARLRGVEGPSPHDIDVMVIGEPDPEQVDDACDRVEASVHRPVNAMVLSRAEVHAAESGFLSSVRSGPMVPLVGDLPWP